MVGVAMSYRRAPKYHWPAGAEDVAAAASWIHQNIDLFGGDAREIIAVGYSVGAFHLATFLAHPELQAADSNIAGAVLVSGIYLPADDTDDDARSYFGADGSKYADCPRIAQVTDRDTPASVFDLHGAGKSLAERTKQLIDQIEMRGLP